MKECIFDQIIEGKIPSKKVFESETVLAVWDINPVAPVHVLIIPKRHIENLNFLGPENREIAADLLLAVKEVAKIMKVADSGYRVIINNGREAGQLVPHLHLHLIAGKDLGPKIV